MTSVDDTAGGGEVLHRVVERTRSLGEQTAFYGNALAATPDAVTRYPAEVLRLIAGMGMGTGALAVIGVTVAIIGFLTLCTGALIAAQGYDTLSNVGIEALTGFLGAFLNVRFIAPATAGVALAATIGAGATGSSAPSHQGGDRRAGGDGHPADHLPGVHPHRGGRGGGHSDLHRFRLDRSWPPGLGRRSSTGSRVASTTTTSRRSCSRPTCCGLS